jgi:phosphate transport system substrate-binding protein
MNCLRALLLLAALGAALPLHAAEISLKETGSTLLLPLFQIWVAEYGKNHPGVTISLGGTGSEAGIKQATSGAVEIGASDAYMSDDLIHDSPDMLNIALAIAAQIVTYNLPGLPTQNLRLDGPTLAGIYTGAVRDWDAPEIAKLNPGLALPHHQIVPVHRADGSGDTFALTQFLSFSTPSWENVIYYGTSIKWPDVPGAIGARGNSGMMEALKSTPYAIGYLGIPFSDAALAAGLGISALKNAAGRAVLPTEETISSAAAVLGPRTPDDERLTLAFAEGENSYPLVTYEYAIVARIQRDAASAAALRRFLLWCIEPSEDKAALLAKVHFIPLPPHTWELSQAQIHLITAQR